MVSITVLVITYNQQDVIGRALDSVLQQKEWGLKDIVVCDDHSTDNNWEVIQCYVSKYPKYIRAYRNNPNLGIYNNVEKTYSLRGDADVFINLSGDDALCDGYFKNIQNFIENKRIDIQNTASIICYDCKLSFPNGREINVKSNRNVIKCKEPNRLKFRGLLHGRGLVISSKVMSRYNNIAEGKSTTLAEWLCDQQSFDHADKVYYSPFVANIYYTQLGVSTTMKDEQHYKNDICKWEYIYDNYPACDKDKYYALMRKHELFYAITPSVNNLICVIKYFTLSRDFSIPFNLLSCLFAIRMIVKSTFRAFRKYNN